MSERIIMEPGRIYRPRYIPTIDELDEELWMYYGVHQRMEGHSTECEAKCISENLYQKYVISG